MIFFIIRMWAPSSECSNPSTPHFVTEVLSAAGEGTLGGMTQWTVTRTFADAFIFKHERPALSVVKNVRRIADRIQRGWLYEVIQIQEKIVASNVPEEEKEVA